ncbi:MAG TPA: mechanosensitive ion channel [Deltaproteobacteria bacterium]|nr:mechanosensitive ion channel [Deltaproteobacteria bacterium]HPJ95292.1 mechanosensitive ion channel [Deltaproteobacteria bacterium]HPR53172.1 mechanosensitive ion channel [Deltaproteobacteria bacterium]
MEDILVRIQELITLYGLKIVAALLILIVGRWIAKIIRSITGKILMKRSVEPMIASFVENLIYIALLVFIVIAALAQLGIQTTSFIAVIGAAGLAIGLALQGSLSNFAAGFLILIFRPFKAGDYVEAGGTAGMIEKIQVFTTHIVTLDNKEVIIPNSKIMGDTITNYTGKDKRRVDLVFGVSYGDNIDKVREVIKNVIKKDNRIFDDPEPAILVSELADSSVNFTVRVWVNTSDYWGVFFNTIEMVKKAFDAEGITIPFPQQDIHMFQAKN